MEKLRHRTSLAGDPDLWLLCLYWIYQTWYLILRGSELSLLCLSATRGSWGLPRINSVQDPQERKHAK